MCTRLCVWCVRVRVRAVERVRVRVCVHVRVHVRVRDWVGHSSQPIIIMMAHAYCFAPPATWALHIARVRAVPGSSSGSSASNSNAGAPARGTASSPSGWCARCASPASLPCRARSQLRCGQRADVGESAVLWQGEGTQAQRCLTAAAAAAAAAALSQVWGVRARAQTEAPGAGAPAHQ